MASRGQQTGVDLHVSQTRVLSWHLRTATWHELAGVAVIFAGAIEHCRPIIYHGTGGSQHLASRADVDVALLIVGEVFPKERPVGTAQSGGHLEYLDDIAGLTDRLRVRPRKD